jgi:hypothetical protein
MSYTRTFRAKALMLTPMGVAGGFCCLSLHRSQISEDL